MTQQTLVKQGNGLGVAALVLGIIAVLFAFIPLIGVVAFALGGLALILGIIGALKKNRPRGTSIAGAILGLASIIIAGVITAGTVAAVDAIDQEINKESVITYKATSENEADATFGETSGTSNETFTGEWTTDTTVTGWDAASLIVQNSDYMTDQKVSCEILVDGESVTKQSGTNMATCSGSTN
ncbi:DUF308 domain-containing protein [Glutamicibacter sp. 287]|uniref:DUF308 domain-containing protein n=1 Tax=unclassified Glutamicibacter TaxID=2627139 RepID=UPI000BB86799|nr:DUF308 domain-containing protein [Glutamicibacter sp. BW80]PCC28733.1 hypothetical protein CIK76_08365 [Glutamicibacter sp. BW80]